MATLVLTSAVAAFSGYTGFALFAAQLAATAVGSFIDSRLFARNQNVRTEGPRLQQLNVTSSAEGAAINRLYGTMRLGGQVIWASRFEEEVVTTTSTQSGGGGKGGGGGGSVTQTSTTYNYYLSFAVAFCEGGERTSIGRIWADGRLLDTGNITFRFYPGTLTQSPDSYIQTVEGSANTPAFRSIAYVMFERMPIGDFGNRMPQITAEITKPIISDDPDKLENILQSVTMIPGSGEFVYGTIPYLHDDGYGNSESENVHRLRNTADFMLSLDDLENSLPNIDAVSLVVSWFGDDLRLGNCTVKPCVERHDKTNFPSDWQVNGISRASASAVSTDGQGRPIYGGTPSDQTVVQAIQELKDRGVRVYFYPFILMDIPGGNSLPNPYSNNAATNGQPAFPWRGRITPSPARGYTGTVDKTATAATQMSAFFGSCAASDISVSGTTVSYTGSSPTEFGYRRMVLHYAKLCAAAGGVDGFFIGSELVEITRARSSSSAFPGVSALSTLADDVAAIFSAAGQSSTQLSYAANWDEYHSHRPDDGSNDVYFNMDALWTNSNIDFIGIDFYAPISDWRNGTNHLDYDAVNGPTRIYDKTYLAANIEGGEYFDWYYADQSARDSQTRTNMTDPTYSKPWVFANKNIRAWWANQHYNRPGGTESGSPTSWTAEGKPIFFSEFGCPAVDKGTNQPNVFYDPKSSEAAFPYYSNGLRDDLIQRQYYETLLTYWRDNAPTSGVYGDKMIKPENMFGWTWDARPYPAYPTRSDVWSDSANYKWGHWLNGRVGKSTLAELVKEICALVGFDETDIDVSALLGTNTVIAGYTIDSVMAAKDALNPLMSAFLFDGYESNGKIVFVLRIDTQFEEIDTDDFVVDDSNKGGYTLTRTQETELPKAARVTFVDAENAYQPGSAPGLKVVGASYDTIEISFPIVMEQSYARSLADVIIQESWSARESGELALPPSMARFEPGDGIQTVLESRDVFLRISKVTRGPYIKTEVSSYDPSIYNTVDFSGRGATFQDIPAFGRAVVHFVDIPLLSGQEDRPWAPRVAGYMNPMPSAINVYRDLSGTLDLVCQILKPAVVGRLNSALYGSPAWKIDRGNTLVVDLNNLNDTLVSVTDLEFYNGKNACAVQGDDGSWEVIQFREATLLAPGRYALTYLLRGQLGTENKIVNPASSGNAVVFLNQDLLYSLGLPLEQKLLEYDYHYGAAELETDSVFYQEETLTFTAAGLLPYAPTWLRARRNGTGGDMLLQWTRRTRFNGDDWEPPDTPLNEEYEKYDLEIYNGSTLVRELIDLTEPQYLYTAANQTTDFGSPQTGVKIRVYQKSATIGRGQVVEQTVYMGIQNG